MRLRNFEHFQMAHFEEVWSGRIINSVFQSLSRRKKSGSQGGDPLLVTCVLRRSRLCSLRSCASLAMPRSVIAVSPRSNWDKLLELHDVIDIEIGNRNAPKP